MKTVPAYYLLLLYLVVICKPIIPVASDLIAHMFWKEQHISIVHHEKGKDHLHNELIDNNSEDSVPENSLKYSEPASVHLITETIPGFSYPFPFVITNSGLSCDLLYHTKDIPIPPPKS